MRWYDYILVRDGEPEFDDIFGGPSDESVLYILGEGFDPRTTVGLARAAELRKGEQLSILTLELSSADSAAVGVGDDVLELARTNREWLDELVETYGLRRSRLNYLTVADPASAGLAISRTVVSEHCESFSRVVVDVSAMPTRVFFPLIGALLKESDPHQGTREFELLVVACENPELDDRIVRLGTRSGSVVGGFRHGFETRVHGPGVRIWAPLLGQGEESTIRAVYRSLEPDEVCPILPYPARQPRRSDDLLHEYNGLLFDEMLADAANLIYADEANPFDLYRTLLRLRDRYTESLAPIGEATVILSAHASKLLALGVMLAAYENELPVFNADTSGHTLADGTDVAGLAHSHRLTCAWLQGTPYRCG